MTFSLIIFILIFLIAVNYFQLVTFASLIVGPKIKTNTIIDKWIINTIKYKTGLVLKNIKIFHDKRPYAMMGGIYPFPILIISEKMRKLFNKDEMEWVVLHETGHHLLWHNLEAIIIEGVTISLGVKLIHLLQLNIFSSGLLSIFFSILAVQIIRYGIEYQADKFSILRVSDPEGVITAQAKLKKYYKDSLFNSEKSLLRILFHWNISPGLRIKMAKMRYSS
ncbi:MAG: M48 family metallopeptidase [Candidatus Roizmanbacteria bacterium]|nr:M48 family metallopeptidase [Candidatus Roizmanbacteria bacterium]